MAGGEDLYQMLGLDKTASQADIKKAYYKLALQWHPDRNSSPEATAKFQALQRIYDVLSNPEKRKVYDRTGNLQDCEEMVHGRDFDELFAAFRESTRVSEEDVDSFAVKYRGSAQERADLLQYYQRFKGSMQLVFEWLILSRQELDSHRFKDTLDTAIAAGEIAPTKAYKQWAAKVAAMPAPSADPLAPPKQAEKGKSKGRSKGGDDLALVAAIKSKASTFNSMMASLEAKYAGKGNKKRRPGSSAGADDEAAAGSRKCSSKKGGQQQQQDHKKAKNAATEEQEEIGACDSGVSSGGESGEAVVEPTEEEFEAARARLEARKAAVAAAAAATAGNSKARKGKAAGRAAEMQSKHKQEHASNGAAATKKRQRARVPKKATA